MKKLYKNNRRKGGEYYEISQRKIIRTKISIEKYA